MGLFNTLMSKIFHHASNPAPAASTSSTSAPAPATPATPPVTQASATPAMPAPVASPTPAPSGTTAPAQPVDVAAILDDLKAKNPEKLDWRHSIVDLMKLVGMDSSLSARKELAQDLHYSGDMNDSASMNMWLHKEVMKKLAENGGKVPQDLLDK
jgi:3-oxoacyl-ACP reductase-like protein